jgi:hypothetical protein
MGVEVRFIHPAHTFLGFPIFATCTAFLNWQENIFAIMLLLQTARAMGYIHHLYSIL